MVYSNQPLIVLGLLCPQAQVAIDAQTAGHHAITITNTRQIDASELQGEPE